MSPQSRRPVLRAILALTALATLVIVGGGAPGGSVAAETSSISATSEIQPSAFGERVLSHVLCRTGQFRPPFAGPSVHLEDEFGSWDATVLHPNWWCNPVRKVRAGKVTKIVDQRHHLKFYPLQLADPTGSKDLLVTNQFGADQSASMNNKPVYLVVPTRELPLGRPRGVDHFLCYNVFAAPTLKKRVRLQDEFGGFRTRVQIQWLICNPVEKTHGSAPPTPILHEDLHLACYIIPANDPGRAIAHTTVNQFEPRSVNAKARVRDASSLCVPSVMQVVP
jgi:hypothetical protein